MKSMPGRGVLPESFPPESFPEGPLHGRDFSPAGSLRAGAEAPAYVPNLVSVLVSVFRHS